MSWCHRLPFWVWCISGSCARSFFLVGIGAAVMVASMAVPSLSRGPLVVRLALTASKHLLGELVYFQQVAKAQDADQVGQTSAAVQTFKVSIQRCVQQSLFYGEVTQAEPLLDDIQSQHGFVAKRWAPRGFLQGHCINQSHQFAPGQHRFHLIKQLRCAGAPRVQLQPQAAVFIRVLMGTRPVPSVPARKRGLNTIPRSSI